MLLTLKMVHGLVLYLLSVSFKVSSVREKHAVEGIMDGVKASKAAATPFQTCPGLSSIHQRILILGVAEARMEEV